jgi:S-adenosylmethionine-diacylglycerol 3-amino-3-carboxypropyl transferase
MKGIQYANCWEDADILLKAFNTNRGKSFCSIASAGDNTLSLLTQNPSMVVAVDMNKAQLACLELRRAAFTRLSYEEILQFLGIKKTPSRLKIFSGLYDLLSRQARSFWNSNLNAIKKGIIHAGKTEHYFNRFRKWIMPVLLNKKTVADIFIRKNEQVRISFFEENFNSKRWGIFYRLLAKPYFLSKYITARQRAKTHTCGDKHSNIVFMRVKRALTSLPSYDNPYLEYIITGNFTKNLPHYLRPENFKQIKKNLDKLDIHGGDLFSILRAHPAWKFDAINLSDIFDRMNGQQYCAAIRQLALHAKPRARLVYWNNLYAHDEDRRSYEPFSILDDLSQELFMQDRGFFYNNLIILEKK